MRSLEIFSRYTLMAWIMAAAILGTVQNAGAGGVEIKLETALAASAGAGDISGKVKFENRLQEGRRKFSAQVEGFSADALFDVMISGIVVGTVQIGATGNGEINFDDNFEPGDDPATQFPANFPALDGGELIQIGPLSGTLQAK